MRLAVFASGRGSNFAALLDARKAGKLPEAEFALLVSDNPEAPALEIGRLAGIEAMHFAPKSYPSKIEYEDAILKRLKELKIEAIILAGYMRIIGTTLLRAFPHKIINIHPALLPSFPGTHGHRDALAYGVKISGCTVHFVDEGVDTGPIIVQRCVEVKDDDTEATLAARILVEEHKAFPEAVDLFTRGLLKIEGRRVVRLG